jgi:hypothetical protein
MLLPSDINYNLDSARCETHPQIKNPSFRAFEDDYEKRDLPERNPLALHVNYGKLTIAWKHDINEILSKYGWHFVVILQARNDRSIGV